MMHLSAAGHVLFFPQTAGTTLFLPFVCASLSHVKILAQACEEARGDPENEENAGDAGQGHQSLCRGDAIT